MDSPGFDPLEFARFAWLHRKPAAAAIATAVILSAAASMLLPKRYTATASLLIDLPAGADPRAAAAVSPVYLESLRTYEHFASSDTIFLEAMNRLGIRPQDSGKSIEAVKSSVLRISKPASTRILEISATLNDAVAAQRLAQYLAERTVELNRSLAERATRDVVRQAETALQTAEETLARVNAKQEQFARSEQPEAVRADIQNLSELRYDLDRDFQETEAGLEELKAREDPDSAREIAGFESRIAAVQRRDQALAAKIREQGSVLGRLQERLDVLGAEQQSARTEAEAARHRLDEVRSSAPYQGERLSVLDPGIVPERPTSPNPVLNVASAFFLSAAGALFWIALRYGYRRKFQTARTREHAGGVYRLAE